MSDTIEIIDIDSVQVLEVDSEPLVIDVVTEGPQGASGISAYQLAVNNGFVGNEAAWLASLHGADGADGVDGTDGTDGTAGAAGLSAYQIAVNNGFVGNEAAWLASLHGADGADGTDGIDGTDGADGASGAGVSVSVDFGLSFSDKAQTVVTGQAWVTATSKITAQVLTPSGVDPDEMYLLDIKAVISNIVDGVGFTVTLYSQSEAKGVYSVMCLGV